MIFAEVTTWQDVLDDVVKIGLGAMVGGFYSLRLAVKNYRLSRDGEYSKRIRDSLEKIALDFDRVASEIYRIAIDKSVVAQGKGPTNDQVEILKTKVREGKILRQSMSELESLAARLQLLNCKGSAELVLKELIQIAPLCTDKSLSVAEFAALHVVLLKSRRAIATQFAKEYKNA